MKLKLVVLSVLGCLTVNAPPMFAKTWTADQRQMQQMKDINAAQRSGKLTAKESEKLRSNLASVARKKAKLRLKQNGNLTAEDNTKMHKDLDSISAKIARSKETKSSSDK